MNESPPKIITVAVCDPHSIHPTAVPEDSETPYKNNILDIIKGNAPKPPLVKVTAKLPTTKLVIMIPIERDEVSCIVFIPK